MGRAILSGIVPMLTVPVTIKANFADNNWASIVSACHQNIVPATWVVGNQKTMTINGTAYVIDIIGKGHDDYADGSGKAPLTFQMHDCYSYDEARGYMNSVDTNISGWTICAMRQTNLPDILALMPMEVQNGIREVNKLTSAGDNSSTINTTADKLFLLSEIEVFGTTQYSYTGEGKQYEYYSAGNSKVKNIDLYGDVVAIPWWERSPEESSSMNFCYVSHDGTAGGTTAGLQNGVAFAFCF